MDFEWSQTNVMTQCTPFLHLPLADLWLPHHEASLTTCPPFLRNEYCSNIVFTCFALCAGGDIVSNTPILPAIVTAALPGPTSTHAGPPASVVTLFVLHCQRPWEEAVRVEDGSLTL